MKNILILTFLFFLSCKQSSEGSKKKSVSVQGDPIYQESVFSFYDHLYPKLEQYCATCHKSSQTPYLASNDVTLAHDAIILNGKVDANNALNSRLYLRAKIDRHNCDAFDCDIVADEIAAGLEEWLLKIDQRLLKPRGVLSQSLQISSGEDVSTDFNSESIPGKKISLQIPSAALPGGANLSLEIYTHEEHLPEMYLVKNVELTSGDEPLAFSGLRIHINDTLDPLENKFLTLTGIVLANESKMISNPNGTFKMTQTGTIDGPESDSVSISFERLQIYK